MRVQRASFLYMAILATFCTASMASDMPARPQAQEDMTPAPCFEGECPVCAKVGPLATIWACTAMVRDPTTEQSARAEAYFERSGAHWQRKEYAAQIDDLSSAIDALQRYMFDKHETENGFLREYYMNRAYARYRAGEYAEAIADRDKAYPGERPDVFRAMANWHLGRYELALDDLRKNTDGPDTNTYSIYCRALVLFSLQNYAGAVEDFTKAVTRLRENIAATQRLRSVLSNYRKLEPDEIDDADDKAMLAKSLFLRSRALQQMGDTAAANVDLAEAMALDPEYANPEVI